MPSTKASRSTKPREWVGKFKNTQVKVHKYKQIDSKPATPSTISGRPKKKIEPSNEDEIDRNIDFKK